MNTNDRATLRRWISEAWFKHRLAMACYSYGRRGKFVGHHLHQGQRWARFAVACERRLKKIGSGERETLVQETVERK